MNNPSFNKSDKPSFTEAYAKVHSIAERLRNGGAKEIDTLLEDLREAREAYNICRERLDEIRKEIEAELARTGGTISEADPFAA